MNGNFCGSTNRFNLTPPCDSRTSPPGSQAFRFVELVCRTSAKRSKKLSRRGHTSPTAWFSSSSPSSGRSERSRTAGRPNLGIHPAEVEESSLSCTDRESTGLRSSSDGRAGMMRDACGAPTLVSAPTHSVLPSCPSAAK